MAETTGPDGITLDEWLDSNAPEWVQCLVDSIESQLDGALLEGQYVREQRNLAIARGERLAEKLEYIRESCANADGDRLLAVDAARRLRDG